MKYVPQSVSRAVSISLLQVQKNSPTILFVAGLTGAVAATVLACKATLKIDPILTDTQKYLLDTDRLTHQRDSQGIRRYTDKELQQAKAKIYIDSAVKITKLYAPAIVVGAVSVGCLTQSHRQLTQRNATLTAAYVSLQNFLEGYRGRVREKVGEEQERDIYYAATPVELVEDDGKKGVKKVYGSTPSMPSPYSCVFDETRRGIWQDQQEYNIHYVKLQERQMTDKLRANGYLFLSDVYARFDVPPTQISQVCGWFIDHPKSDDFVEITIMPMHDFHGSMWLDFNVAGNVLKMLDERSVR